MTELPEEAFNPEAPAGTPPAKAAGEHLAPFWCAHGVMHFYFPIMGGYLPQVDEVDAIHQDIPLRTPGALPYACQPATAFDPAQYPNAGPGAVS